MKNPADTNWRTRLYRKHPGAVFIVQAILFAVAGYLVAGLLGGSTTP